MKILIILMLVAIFIFIVIKNVQEVLKIKKERKCAIEKESADVSKNDTKNNNSND